MGETHSRAEASLPPPEPGDPHPAIEELGDRRICILDAAREVLASEGYHYFSMRRVARRAQMHHKTLQHYYPTKKELLLGTLQYTLSKYLEEYRKILAGSGGENPRETFRRVIQYFLDDLRDPVTSRFFPELWALASRDPDAALAVDRLYSFLRRRIDELVRAMNPTLTEQKSAQRVFPILAMIDGMLLYVGHRKPEHKELHDIDEEVIRAAIQIVFAP